jgi:hypothetical protein
MAYSIYSNQSEHCSIIWWSGSTREIPKLVFRGVLLVGGGAEHLHGGAISIWAPKGLSVGVTELKGDSRGPRGTVVDLEVGGGKPRGTVLKPKLFKGH